MIYKRPPTLQVEGTQMMMRSFSPSPCELLELSARPIVNSVHLQYQTAGPRALTSKEELESG
jgi:hypothetical protein